MEMLFFVAILIFKQGHIQAAAVFLSCPNHAFSSSVDNFITGWFDSSVLANVSCAFPVQKNEFVLRQGSVDTKICDQDFSTSTVICNTNYNAQNCKCDSNSGTNYSYTLKFVANSVSNAGDIILRSDCRDSSLQKLFQSQPCSIVFDITTVPSTTTETPPCENCKCNNTCKCPDNCSKCPVWCIVVSVCVPVGGCLIITITVIIIKYKKKEKGVNRSVTVISQVEPNGEKQESVIIISQVGHNGTKAETLANPLQEGHKPAKLSPIPKKTKTKNEDNVQSVQDTKEMQDRNKHLAKNSSPEKEKRRKKKKKKKTFQEVDGESVSREEKSTVNGHRAAQKSQNVNSVSVNENSPTTYNGELRRLPMPKTAPLTSVERNSTIFQSETTKASTYSN